MNMQCGIMEVHLSPLEIYIEHNLANFLTSPFHFELMFHPIHCGWLPSWLSLCPFPLGSPKNMFVPSNCSDSSFVKSWTGFMTTADKLHINAENNTNPLMNTNGQKNISDKTITAGFNTKSPRPTVVVDMYANQYPSRKEIFLVPSLSAFQSA
jgi:hypothetical protein